MTSVKDLIIAFGRLLDQTIVLLVGIALLVFFWGLTKFLYKGSEKAIEEGKNIMVWGVIALFVMVSVWGLVGFVGRTLGIYQWTEPGIQQKFYDLEPRKSGKGFFGI